MPSASSAIDALRDLTDLMETAQGENEQLQICRPGRPRIEISENQLHFLVENNFRVKWTEFAKDPVITLLVCWY